MALCVPQRDYALVCVCNSLLTSLLFLLGVSRGCQHLAKRVSLIRVLTTRRGYPHVQVRRPRRGRTVSQSRKARAVAATYRCRLPLSLPL